MIIFMVPPVEGRALLSILSVPATLRIQLVLLQESSLLATSNCYR
jgi:hypothetical protein